VQGHLVRRPGRCWRRCLSVGLPGGGWARTRAAARRCTASRGGGGDGDGDGEVAADGGGAERARGAGNLHTIIHTYIHARTTCTAPLGQRASSGGRGHTHARRHPFSTRCQESESPSISKNRRAIRPYSNSTLLLFRHYGGGVGAGRAAVRIGMGYGVAGARHHPRRACPSLGGRTLTFFTTARPPPAYVRTRTARRGCCGGAAGGVRPQVHPGIVRGARAAAGL